MFEVFLSKFARKLRKTISSFVSRRRAAAAAGISHATDSPLTKI
jgi:hypothetical protein